jgi:hypothetical protein
MLPFKLLTLASSQTADPEERRVAPPAWAAGGRVGSYTLVERVQSLPASFSLPPPTLDGPDAVLALGDGGPAAWLNILALTNTSTEVDADGGLPC